MGALLFLLLTSAHAGNVHEPEISVRISGQKIEVRSSVMLPMSPCKAYAMLTDYERLPEFIPGLEESRAQTVSRNEVEVFQVGEVPVFIFHVRMESLLDMEETPNRKVVFRQVRGDFASFGGEWDFSGLEGGALVSYKAEMSFKPYVPLVLAQSILDEDLKEKFEAISREAASHGDAFQCAG